MSTTSCSSSVRPPTQNDLLLKNLLQFYTVPTNLSAMMSIINGESRISLRIIDWFITNYSKLYYTIYELPISTGEIIRFKVHDQYKLKLKSFSKKRFDIFCRHQRISILYDKEKSLYLESTIAQLNCFKWVIENRVIDYIEEHYDDILADMNNRNSNTISKKSRAAFFDEDETTTSATTTTNSKTRKKRQELSISAVKTLKKEYVHIVMKFN